MKKSTKKWLPPILRDTILTGGDLDCKHEDVKHLSVKRQPSGEVTRSYIASEFGECRLCGATIEKQWLTAYKNYIEGARASLGV